MIQISFFMWKNINNSLKTSTEVWEQEVLFCSSQVKTELLHHSRSSFQQTAADQLLSPQPPTALRLQPVPPPAPLHSASELISVNFWGAWSCTQTWARGWGCTGQHSPLGRRSSPASAARRWVWGWSIRWAGGCGGTPCLPPLPLWEQPGTKMWASRRCGAPRKAQPICWHTARAQGA